jgi:D-glycero-alpha-D-manno-heptose 1-phosphate guanylyltransferase
MIDEAIILAGGFGTRLKPVLNDKPKPMAPVCGRPFLEHLFDYLLKYGINKVVIAAGYRHEDIISHFGNKFKDLYIAYSIEKEPLGTGGAILKATGSVFSDSFFVMNGDTYFDVDLASFVSSFSKNNAFLSIALKPMENFDRYGSVAIDNEKIISFNEKKFCTTGLINGGIYLIRKSWLNRSAPGKIFSFEKEILENNVRNTHFAYFISDTYFIDIGVPEDYARANEEMTGL